MSIDTRKRTVWAAVAVLLGTVLAGVSAAEPARAQADPAAIHQQFLDALNAGDVDGALAFLVDDAVFEGAGPRCPPPCQGSEAIRQLIESQVADHILVTRTSAQVSGNTLTARAEVTSDGTRAAGIERIIVSFTVEFSGAKISRIRQQPDVSDPQTASLIAQQRGGLQPAAPATGTGGRLAQEGTGLAVWWYALAAFGAAAAGAGAALRATIGRRR